jgi:hypothetical protein
MSVENHDDDDDDDDDDASWRSLLTDPPELSGNPTSRDILEQVGRMDEGVIILHISI